MKCLNACVDDDDDAHEHTPLHRPRQSVGGREGGGGGEKARTHHLAQLDGRLAYLIPNPNRDLKAEKELVNYHI